MTPKSPAWARPASSSVEVVARQLTVERPEWMDDETYAVVNRAARAGVLVSAPTRPRPTVEELEADARAFTDAAGPDGVRAILEALDDGRG